MYKLKIDVVEKNGLTSTYDSTSRFENLEEAAEAATVTRNALFDDYSNYAILDYSVDIVPAND